MIVAEIIYRESMDLPITQAQEVLDFIGFLKKRHIEKSIDTSMLQKTYEQAHQQAIAFMANPPFTFGGNYLSRDSLYDRL